MNKYDSLATAAINLNYSFDDCMFTVFTPNELKELELEYKNKNLQSFYSSNITRIIRNMRFINEMCYHFSNNGETQFIMSSNVFLDEKDTETVNFLTKTGIDSIFMILKNMHKIRLEEDTGLRSNSFYELLKTDFLVPLYDIFFQYVIRSYNKKVHENHLLQSQSNFENIRDIDESLDIMYLASNYRNVFKLFEMELIQRFQEENTPSTQVMEEDGFDYCGFIHDSFEMNRINLYINNLQIRELNKLLEFGYNRDGKGFSEINLSNND